MEIVYAEFLIGMLAAFFLLTLVMIFFTSFRVEEGHAAILTRFGAVLTNGKIAIPKSINLDSKREENLKVFGPGIHWKYPWDKVLSFSTMERILELSGAEGGQNTLTNDGTQIRVDSKVRYKPHMKKLYFYLMKYKTPMEHIHQLFSCLIRNEIANFKLNDTERSDFIGSYSEIKGDLKDLNRKLDQNYTQLLNINYGVEFRGLDLIDIFPPRELESALNAIQRAQTESDTMFSRAEGDARQRIEAAEKGFAIAKTNAEAAEIRIRTSADQVKYLLQEGQWAHYLKHRRTELFSDSKLMLINKGEV